MPPATRPARMFRRAVSRSIGRSSIRTRGFEAVGKVRGTPPRRPSRSCYELRHFAAWFPEPSWRGTPDLQPDRIEARQLAADDKRLTSTCWDLCGELAWAAAVPGRRDSCWILLEVAAGPWEFAAIRVGTGYPSHKGSRNHAPHNRARPSCATVFGRGVSRPPTRKSSLTQTLAAIAIERNSRAR